MTYARGADLIAGALLAGYAGNHTHAVCALFTNQTVIGTAAGIPTLTIVTGGAKAVIVTLTLFAISDTGSGIQRTWDESFQTLTLSLAVLNAALSIWTTGTIANILALFVDTNTLVRTISIPIGTAAFRETASFVGVSHLSLVAGAGISRGTGSTNS